MLSFFAHLRAIARDPSGLVGLLLVAVLLFVAIFGTLLAPQDPTTQNLAIRYTPPAWVEGGSLGHLLGTDSLGRDILSRVIVGTRVSTVVGVCAVLMQLLIGVVAGLMAGYKGGLVDSLVMRLTDVWLTIPLLVLALALAVVLGTGLWSTVLVLGIVGWVTFARIVRAEVLSVREREYVMASKVSGASSFRTIVAEILPNVSASIIVVATLQISRMIIIEASLSFLGLGIQPPDIAWGSMIADGRQSLTSAWWVATMPGFALLITILGVNLFGDALRDELDPKVR